MSNDIIPPPEDLDALRPKDDYLTPTDAGKVLLAKSQKENRPFVNDEGWRKRSPRCPTCDKPLSPDNYKGIRMSRRVLTEWVDVAAFDVCQADFCTPDEHMKEEKRIMWKCARKKCAEQRRFIADMAHGDTRLRCKCKLPDDFHWSEMQQHLGTKHQMTQHDIVQMIFDNQRPHCFQVERSDSRVWIGLTVQEVLNRAPLEMPQREKAAEGETEVSAESTGPESATEGAGAE